MICFVEAALALADDAVNDAFKSVQNEVRFVLSALCSFAILGDRILCPACCIVMHACWLFEFMIKKKKVMSSLYTARVPAVLTVLTESHALGW